MHRIFAVKPRTPTLRATLLLLLAATAGCSILQPVPATPAATAQPPVPLPMDTTAVDPRVELLWDSYGVPHIHGDDPAAMFYAFGWAQMHSHANLILQLYGQARGRAAEYWGERFVASDVWVRTNGIPERANRWLAGQRPHVAAYLEAFVLGMNAYAQRHPEAVGAAFQQVLPLTASDVLAHQQRVLQFTFVASPALATVAQRQLQAGSNAWAIAPARAAGRNAMLLANPHLPWGDLFTFYEAQLVLPDMSAYGATLVGFPTLAIAFNEHLGWTHTVNTIDAADTYHLRTRGEAYLYDGVYQPFDVEPQVLRIRRPDNTVVDSTIHIRRSVHGPIIARHDSSAIALRVAGLDASQLTEQYWDMMRARNRAEFEVALSRQQLPMFTVMYADRAGDIMHVFNGTVPVRPRGDWATWQQPVSGDSSSLLWTRTHEYHELPRVVNPASGWLQNANDPPWTTTIPAAINPLQYASTIAPQRPMSFRAQRSARMLFEDSRITFDELVAYKHSTRVESADHIVQDIVAAARAVGDEHARAAADVLEQWDRTTDAGSRGAVLYDAFFTALQRQRWPNGSPWEVPWTASAPLATPDGLSDPRLAATVLSHTAQLVRARWGAIDVAWGDVYRLRRDSLDLPASGGPGAAGVFRVVEFDRVPGDSTRFVATSGDTYVAAVEFSKPVRAQTLLTYGNSSQPGSVHRTDQLTLFAEKRLKPVWLTREEVLANLERREVF